MKTLRAAFKTASLLIVIAALLFPSSGCERAGEQSTVDELLAYLQNAEYPRIYKLLTKEAREKISLVDLSKRYDDLFRTLGRQSAACAKTAIRDVDEDHKVAAFTMAVATEKLGEIKLNMEAPLSFENGGWYIDWTSELILPDLEDGDRAVLKPLPAKRGEIFDANGNVLAKNDFALSIYVDSSQVKDYETLIRMLAPKLGMTEKDVRAKLKGQMKKMNAWTEEDDDSQGNATATVSATPTPTPSQSPTASPTQAPSAAQDNAEGIKHVVKAYPKKGLTWEQQQELLAIPGVGIDETSMTTIRYYPYGTLMAQTLGYMGVMSEEDLTKPENAGLPRDALIGKMGLEKSWEQYLRGKPGYELYIEDSKGNRKTTLAKVNGSDGHDLRLSIDLKLQQRAELLLREYLSPQMAGSIIVLDPKTGYIQALASAPTYDLNLFTFAIDPVVWKYMQDPVNMKPLINRATEGLYPPGSTFKPFTASMGLTDGKITANFVFPFEIKNNYWTPGEQFGVESPIKRAEATQGKLNLQNAITYSDNIYFAYTALKVGASKFYDHCLEIGIGLDKENRMKFDVPINPSSIAKTGKISSQRMLADSGYGQGEFQVTPLQMAATFGSLANGGDIMQPRIVKSECATTGPLYIANDFSPSVWRPGVVPKSNLNLLLPALKRVAQVGTAKDLNKYKKLKDYEICAKTGTAEVGTDKTKEIAWIIGFTTKKIDRLVCVSIEVPAQEGAVRIEIAKRMFEE